MASDRDTKASTKKRVTMSAKEKDKQAPDATQKKKARDAASDDSEAPAAFEDGMEVRVRNAENDKELLAATVVHVHRSGELSVKYDKSGEIEKYVKLSRVQQRSSAQASDKAVAVFEEGDGVLYKAPSEDSEEEKKTSWREGSVKACRKDGSYDVIDTETEEVSKKVPKSAVKKSKRRPKTKAKARKEAEGGESVSDGDESEEKLLLTTDAPIEYKSKKGTWCAGRIHKARSDGTFDVVHENDDNDNEEDTIVKRVDRKLIRKPKKLKSKRKAGSDKDGNEDEDTSMRKRRTLSKNKGKKLQDDDEDDGDDNDKSDNSETKASSRKQLSRSGGTRTLFASMRVNQVVQFPGKDGRMHRGRIKLLRKDDDTCDIEHESDTEVVSKRVAIDDVRAVSAFSRLMGRPAWMNQDPRVFQLNARVLYRTKDGMERKAVVVKVWRDTSKEVGPAYDIEDIMDGNVVKKVPGSKLRPVPWLNYSLPQMPGFSTSLFSTIPRKGMKVRFRRRSGESGHSVWEDGVIVRAKSDGTCMIEYTTSKGSKEQAQVKNGDIQTRFISPFSNPLKDFLPAIELPKSVYVAGSFVEVSSGSKVFLGSVVSSNEQDRTYVIAYNDGRKEKNVSADRVRLSLRKLRIGTEVEMIVEGPCKEVSKLDGEVAWVHRDEKVAVRINGGNNDVFAQVCSHALMVDGKPAFSAPLSSTWLEQMGFYLNLTAEMLVYMWLCFGMIVEMGEMVRLFSDTSKDFLEDEGYMTELYATRGVNWSTCELATTTRNSSSSSAASYLLIPEQELETDRAWLVVLLAVKALLTAGCAGFAARLVRSKVLAIQDDYIDIREYQLDQVRRRHLSHIMGAAIVVSYLTLIVYASLLNRFEYYCLLQDAAASIRFDALALKLSMFSVHSVYATTVDLLLQLAAKTTLNLFRAMALHALVFAFPVSNTAFLKRVLLLLPSIGLAALICAMGVAALHVFYYVQKFEVVVNRTLFVTTSTDWAVVLVLVTLWLNANLFSIIAAAGRYFESLNERSANSRGDVTEDVLDQAERGEFGLQAKREVLLTKVEQLQEQLGVCKLSVVRVHSLGLAHLVTMILGIYANCSLRDSVEQQRSHSAGSSSLDAVLKSMTFHLVICILWLVTTVFATLYALAIKQEPKIRELWSFLLDV